MPKKTLATIIKSENDYIVEVKGNQPKLKKQIGLNIDSSKPIDINITEEKNRGRFERREAYLYDTISNIGPEWIGINRLVKMVRSGTRNNKPYKEVHYMITSLKTNSASKMAKAIRAHWSIENTLHYVKDVNMNEDNSGIKGKFSSQNLSIFKNIAINIYRFNGMRSLKEATMKYTNRITQQINLIGKTYILKI